MDLVKGEPERLLPVDSEHAALAMAIRGERREDLKRVVITGSGGPFRGWTRNELAARQRQGGAAHPVWSMGPKITIDSATLMNKGLEVIEAHYLFELDYSQIHVVIHPEGIVHGMAEFRDGSLRAQMATADMRLPIQLALAGRSACRPASSRCRSPSSAAHVRAGRPRSVPRGRPGLPGRRSGAHVPGGDERGERGGRHGVPGREDPAHPHRRARPDGGGRARARIDRLRGARSSAPTRWARRRAAEIIEER